VANFQNESIFLKSDPLSGSRCTVLLSSKVGSNQTSFMSNRPYFDGSGYFAPGSGCHKVAIGYRASYCDSGNGQTSIGWYSLSFNTGSDNTSIGYLSMGICGGAGSGNTAIGAYSLARLTSGNDNVSIGFKNLECLTTGSRNVSLGACAGLCVTTFNNTITIGFNSRADTSNSVAIGYASRASGYATAIGAGAYAVGTDATAIGSVYAGDGCVFWGGPANDQENCAFSAWSYYSDRRDKTDITDLNEQLGINFIRKLRPVKYKLDNRNKYVIKCGFEYGQKDGTLSSKKESYGLIAQEVAESVCELNLKFDVPSISDLSGAYKISYSDFIPVLVKTIQQIDDRINQIKNKLEENATI